MTIRIAVHSHNVYYTDNVNIEIYQKCERFPQMCLEMTKKWRSFTKNKL